MKRTVLIAPLAIATLLFGVGSKLHAQQNSSLSTALSVVHLKSDSTREDLSRIVQARVLGLPDDASLQQINQESARLNLLVRARQEGISTELSSQEIGKLLQEQALAEQKRALGLPLSATMSQVDDSLAKFTSKKNQLILDGQKQLSKIPLDNPKERDRLYAAQSAEVDKLDRQYAARQYGLAADASNSSIDEARSKVARSMIARQFDLADNLTNEQVSAILALANRMRTRQNAIAILKERQSVSDAEISKSMAVLANALDISENTSDIHADANSVSAINTIKFYAFEPAKSILNINKKGLCSK